MKKILAFVMLMTVLATAVNAQTKKVSILGDSYSTFEGVNPPGYAPFYPNDKNDVKEVGQTWWSLFYEAMGYTLEVNDSWGGTTICNTGYGGWDFANSSFNSRLWKLGNPDIIFVFGGTNDAWANSPVGEYKFSDISKADCYTFRPALAYTLDALGRIYPDATVYAILNSELREEINESFRVICKHYGVKLIELHDIEKQNGHPSINGMKAICDQLTAAISAAQFWGFPAQPQDPSDPYTLTVGETSMTIDAGRGAKIMSYKYGDTEILSQRTFPNQFGSTFWTSPQVEWNWPPVQEYDCRAYTVEKNGDNLVMTSQLSDKLPFRIIKEFVPDVKEGCITINYTIRNEGAEAREVAPWEVTRVPNQGLIFFEAPMKSIDPAGLMPFTSKHGVCWLMPDENKENRKINADGKGWLAYADNGLLLVKKFTDLKGDLQPAPGEAEIQVYINSGKTYIEIENQGAYKMLQPGESLTWSVIWKLLPLKTDAVPSKKLAKQAVQSLLIRSTSADSLK